MTNRNYFLLGCTMLGVLSAAPPPSLSQTGTVTYVDRALGISFDIPVGCHVKVDRTGLGASLYIENDATRAIQLAIRVDGLDDYHTRRARQVDSTDMVKGFALSRSSDASAIDDFRGTTHLDLDTLIDKPNQHGLRTLEIHQILNKASHDPSSLRYVIYVVDISSKGSIRIAMMPNIGEDNPDVLRLAASVSQSFRRVESK